MIPMKYILLFSTKNQSELGAFRLSYWVLPAVGVQLRCRIEKVPSLAAAGVECVYGAT